MGSLYCATPLPTFVEDICANEAGRILAAVLMRSDHFITDPTVKGQWDANILEGKVVIIKNVRGERPKSTDVTEDGFGRQQTQSISRDFTAQYFHPDVIGNEDFYEVLNQDRAHSFWYYTQDNRIWDTGNAIANFDADAPVPIGLNSQIMWDVAVSWSGTKIPKGFAAPAGIFE